MDDLRTLLERSLSLANRGVSLPDMPETDNVIEFVEAIEDDARRSTYYRRACVELEHEQAQDAARAAANAVLDYLARNPHCLGVTGRSLLAVAQASRAKAESLEEALVNRAFEPERSGAV